MSVTKPADGDLETREGPIPVNILAFRTITTLLAQIPSRRPIDVSDNLEGRVLDSNDCREIRISDAFAHLAVGEHDVAAVTTNRTTTSGTKLHVVVCTNDIAAITQPEETTLHPKIISSSKPGDLGERNASAYMEGLEKHW